MYMTLSTEQAIEILLHHNVLGADEYVATRALVEYFEMLEEECVKDLSLDPIGLKCAFSIYTLNEAAETWDIDTSGASEGYEKDYLILQYLRNYTTVIEVDDNTVIVEEF